MEKLEIHSKSYLVRWVDVKSEHTISWSIQPNKKSIHLGLFKHPGSGIAPTPKLQSASFEVLQTPTFKPEDAVADSTTSLSASSAAVQKLQSIGLKLVFWQGSCEANLVTTGKFDVTKGESGMYALVLDNTFSKQFSKTVTFMLLTHPTNAAPRSNSVAHHAQANGAASSQSLRLKPSKSRPQLQIDRRSSDSVPSALPSVTKSIPELGSIQSSGYSLNGGNYFTGVLQKRRRKRGQGYARRFFSLDFATSTLSYYHDRNSLTVRGAVPLTLAAIATNVLTREISIDSGAEVWHLKALNKKDFEAWQNALEFASKPYVHASSAASPRPDGHSRALSIVRPTPEEERDWAKVESLVTKIRTSRDLARCLAKDTDPKYFPSPQLQREPPPNSSGDLSQYPSSTDLSPADFGTGEEYFPQQQERRPFWKRKTSSQRTINGKRSVSAQNSSAGLPPVSNGNYGSAERSASLPRPRLLPDESLHERCMQLLQDLDSVVNEFSSLLAENKERRNPIQKIADSRLSLESIGSQEFFDAEAGDSQLLTINRESDEDAGATEVENGLGEQDDASASELEDTTDFGRSSVLSTDTISNSNTAFPNRPKNFNLASYAQITRRSVIRPPTVTPPSLIGFLRKNVGKDLSTISMPVSANEPISLLQKSAEALEYSELLDAAASSSDPNLRLLNVTAFALSMLSEFRVKERAIRKPFNPMLGETFELIREDKGFRFIAEKVSHRPVRLTCQADAEKWSFTHSPLPSQKFWGKSAELITEGKVRVALHTDIPGIGSEHYSWTPATCFLRNLIAGEKYIEPVGSLVVTCESSGSHAVATFKGKGMFGGRSDEVAVQAFSSAGAELPLGLAGRWTDSFALTVNGTLTQTNVWSVGPLLPNAAQCYGFTPFAASLNELNARDEPFLPPTDSRFRPDQRAAEEGDIDTAENLKGRLEEKQRERRRWLEERNKEWEAAWFVRGEGEGQEEIWRLRGGKDGYWDVRARKGWREKGVLEVFDL